MTKDEARKELLETLEEYCHDKGYNLQVFAGMADWVYTLYPKEKAMTNADKIRAMSDDELADWINNYCACPGCPAQDTCMKGHTGEINCISVIRIWLKQEHKEHGKLTKQDKKAVQDLMAFKARYKEE